MKVYKSAKERSEADRTALRDTVSGIIAEVRANGDKALMEYNSRFDGCGRTELRVSPEEIQAAYGMLSDDEIADIKAAAANIRAFAEAQKESIGTVTDFEPAE